MKRRPYSVTLTSYNVAGKVVEQSELTTEEYYEESVQVIDDKKYRAKRGIRRLEGILAGPKGKVYTEFENRYDKQGDYVGGRVVSDDGTVHED